MGDLVYILCAATSTVCAVLLVRAYRANRSALLLWSSICFVGLAINNLLLVGDVYLPDRDLLLARDLTNLGAVAALVVGLIWNARERA